MRLPPRRTQAEKDLAPRKRYVTVTYNIVETWVGDELVREELGKRWVNVKGSSWKPKTPKKKQTIKVEEEGVM